MSASALAIVGVALTACGQKGALYLPTDPMAKQRTTLPGLLLPTPPASTATDDDAQPPAAAGSAPAGAAK